MNQNQNNGANGAEAVPSQQLEIRRDMGDMFSQTLAMFRSGYFKDVRSHSQAIVKVLAGQELGISPMASMTGIYIINPKSSDAKIQIGAHVLAGLLRQSDDYDFRIVEHTDERCEIEFLRHGEALSPTVAFTIEAAERADLTGKDNWKKYPRNMLFARALSDGVKFHCQDLTLGLPIYTEGDDFGETQQAIPVGPREDMGTIDVAAVEVPDDAEPAPEPATQGQLAELSGLLDTRDFDESALRMIFTRAGLPSEGDVGEILPAATESQAAEVIVWLADQPVQAELEVNA